MTVGDIHLFYIIIIIELTECSQICFQEVERKHKNIQYDFCVEENVIKNYLRFIILSFEQNLCFSKAVFQMSDVIVNTGKST